MFSFSLLSFNKSSSQKKETWRIKNLIDLQTQIGAYNETNNDNNIWLVCSF